MVLRLMYPCRENVDLVVSFVADTQYSQVKARAAVSVSFIAPYYFPCLSAQHLEAPLGYLP